MLPPQKLRDFGLDNNYEKRHINWKKSLETPTQGTKMFWGVRIPSGSFYL
jgi:hypothetical protein